VNTDLYRVYQQGYAAGLLPSREAGNARRFRGLQSTVPSPEATQTGGNLSEDSEPACPIPALPRVIVAAPRLQPYVGAMLDDLKRLFSRTWDSFITELGRREPEDRVADLLSAMRRELVDARAQVPLLEEAHRAAQAELARERRALEDVERRGAMAERIGDAETVRIAGEFAEKHRRRVGVLEEKVRAARAEHALRAEEVDDMMRRYKEADANRFGLIGELRREGINARIDGAMGSADASPRAGAGSFDDFERAAGRIDDQAAYADALRELEMDDSPPPPPRPDDVEERLRELKRRMGR
jgi:phage shock protein A